MNKVVKRMQFNLPWNYKLQTPTQMKCQKRYESLKKPQQLFRVDAYVQSKQDENIGKFAQM